MKKTALLLLLMSSKLTISQTLDDLFNNKNTPVYYLGIDYSHVQLVGGFAQAFGIGEESLTELRDRHFLGWNRVVVYEKEKYDIAKMLKRDSVGYSLDYITELNSKTDLTKLEVYEYEPYSGEDVDQFVEEYANIEKAGIGVFFLAEALNKVEKEAVYYFIAINMSDGSLLLKEKVSGAPFGFGIRNYWAGSVYDVINRIRKKKYKKWEKAYSM